MPRDGSDRGLLRTALALALAAVVFVVVLIGYGYWYYLKRDVPVRYTAATERFEYQSIGDEVTGMPFYIWKALPEVCPELAPPNGYAGFGLTYEPNHDRPIG